jgi:hypothetical protein
MVQFAHCDDAFPPHPQEHPDWAGHDQIDECGFRDVA